MATFNDIQIVKAIKEYDEGIKPRFFTLTHSILILLVYEVLLRLSYNPRVLAYNGVDLWFKLAHFLPEGTFMISALLIMYWGHIVLRDWQGRYTWTEWKKERAEYLKNKKAYKPKEKKPFRPSKRGWYYFGFLALEGFLWGSLTFALLRWIVWLLLIVFVPDLQMTQPFDATESIQDYHTNIVQNIALSLGAGFYEEMIFRGLIFSFFLRLAGAKFPKILGMDKLPGLLGLPKLKVETENHDVLSFMKVAKHKPKDGNYTYAITVAVVLYALSHYIAPFGDEATAYNFIYRCFFGLTMYIIFVQRRFAVVAWTHIFYDLWYFILI
ncbi:MAG: hypothetical protein OHK0039_33900 [Bacteroidia bacterium]